MQKAIDPYLYKNGMPWQRDEFTQCLTEQNEKRIHINMPSVLLIDGGQGQGKTTLALHICDYYNKLARLPPADLRIKNHPQLGLGGVEFTSNFNKCNKLGLPCIIYDEAGDYSRASTLTFFNYQMSKLFQKIRSAKIIVLILLPNFNILDNRLFDDEIIRGAIHCEGRHITVNYGNFRVYDMDQLSWVRYWFNRLPSARRKDSYKSVSPLFHSHFKNLPITRAKQLAILSDFGKESERQEAEINMRGLLSYYDMASKVNRTHLWVRTKIKKLNIEPKASFKNKNYYDKSVLARLLRILETRGMDKGYTHRLLL